MFLSTLENRSFGAWKVVQEGTSPDRKQAESRHAEPSETSSARPPNDAAGGKSGDDLALVQTAVNSLRNPDARALAKALGTDLAAATDVAAAPGSNSLEELGDLDGDGIPEFAFKRMRAVPTRAAGETSKNELESWEVFLLDWDGSRWRASRLTNGAGPFELRVIAPSKAGSPQIALILYAGGSGIPYPTIYQVKDHAALLAWDGRAPESQYQGYPDGKIEFRGSPASGLSEMIATGRSDPGLLHFPKNSTRGFDVGTIYSWDGKSYVPSRTEYQVNDDYHLYQFISALHLHNFRGAYALIDPVKFLSTVAPSLEGFRRLVENSWPEFIDDQIFEAREQGTDADNRLTFELIEEDKHYKYYASFSSDAKRLLTGLERCEEGRKEQ